MYNSFRSLCERRRQSQASTTEVTPTDALEGNSSAGDTPKVLYARGHAQVHYSVDDLGGARAPPNKGNNKVTYSEHHEKVRVGRRRYSRERNAENHNAIQVERK